MKTRVTQAQTRVATEQEAVNAKCAAIETFIERVQELSVESAGSTGATATGGGLVHAGGSGTDGRRAVRQAFAETIRPHSVDDVPESESLLETVRTEFSESVAVALAPATDAKFSPQLKQAVISEARSRREEAVTLRRALDRETDHLGAASETVEDITGWLVEANETPLTDLGFDTLRQRHERLAAHRKRCDDCAIERQQFLSATTGTGASVGISHRTLLPYLYEDFAVDHPLLATLARLDETCAECQRTVRRHLSRRG